jgi:hypothetical protein
VEILLNKSLHRDIVVRRVYQAGVLNPFEYDIQMGCNPDINSGQLFIELNLAKLHLINASNKNLVPPVQWEE